MSAQDAAETGYLARHPWSRSPPPVFLPLELVVKEWPDFLSQSYDRTDTDILYSKAACLSLERELVEHLTGMPDTR